MGTLTQLLSPVVDVGEILFVFRNELLTVELLRVDVLKLLLIIVSLRKDIREAFYLTFGWSNFLGFEILNCFKTFSHLIFSLQNIHFKIF